MPADTLSEKADKPVSRCIALFSPSTDSIAPDPENRRKYELHQSVQTQEGAKSPAKIGRVCDLAQQALLWVDPGLWVAAGKTKCRG
jgi:hypothetical protein